MEKLFINALNSKLAPSTTVARTNITEGTMLNEVALNTAIAESLRTLHEVQSFAKGEKSVLLNFLPIKTDGYIYERNGVIVFLEYSIDSGTRDIESITINKEEGEYPPYYVLQALLLLELITDKSRLGLKDTTMSFVNMPYIDVHSEEARGFASIVRTFENMVSEGVFDPYEEVEANEDMEVFSNIDLLSKLTIDPVIETYKEDDEETEDEETLDTLGSFEDALEELDEDEDEDEDEKEETSSTSSQPSTSEQISFLHEDEKEPTVTSPTATRPTSTDITAESVVLLVEAALLDGVRADDIAKTANVAPSTVYELKDLETLQKRGKNPRKSTLEKIARAVRALHTPTHTPTAKSATPLPTVPTPQVQQPVVASIPMTVPNELHETLKEAVESFKDFVSSFKTPTPTVSTQVDVTNVELDMEHAKSLRPLFFDDTWVKVALQEFELATSDIEDVITFRKNARERLLAEHPEAIFDVEPSFTYMGFTAPLETLIDSVIEDLNLLFKGEAGSGKTTLIQSGSCLLNLPLYTINGSDESNIETIVGFKELEKGNIVFVPGRLVKAMTVGGIFYSDEANMIRPNILAIINGALDHRRELYNEFVGARIKGHQNFRFMAAINEEYEDTRAMNRATLDRSIAMEMTYMTTDQLKHMLRKLDPNTGERDIRMLAQISTALQQGVRDELISPEVASIRNIIYLQKMIRRRSFEVAIKRIIDKYPREDRAAIIGVLSSVDRLNLSAGDILGS